MNLDQIETKCYILALFIREDGERFLLGSGAYEFDKKQLHFIANEYKNDIVEVQGDDGLFLAGQVRRATSQSFDGYIGDATVSKVDIEKYRREFLTFFRKNYYYKVVYIFNDGSAIQRKKGFITEAPEVQELYQFYPNYHVALNFEDVNYYNYLEDSDGNEIYGKSAVIPLSAGPSDGGLEWDEYGAISQEIGWSGTKTVSGSDFSANNPLNYRVPFTEISIIGKTTFTGTPSIAVPAQISSVNGTQTATISDMNNNTDTYTIRLGSGVAEDLRELSGVRDTLSKASGDWRVRRQIREFSNSNLLNLFTQTSTTITVVTPAGLVPANLSAAALAGRAWCNMLPVGTGAVERLDGSDSTGGIKIVLNKTRAANIAQARAVLTGIRILSISGTSVFETITNADLISDLEALLAGELFKGDNEIVITPDSGTTPVLSLSYYTESTGGEGYVWEEGTSGGISTIQIDSIDNVYPIWEVEGPAINPELSNITTATTMVYYGSVAEGQKLIVDMFNKTAFLNGTSVVQNLSGDWVYFKAGTNRVAYTALNNNATPSTVSWQEIVG